MANIHIPPAPPNLPGKLVTPAGAKAPPPPPPAQPTLSVPNDLHLNIPPPPRRSKQEEVMPPPLPPSTIHQYDELAPPMPTPSQDPITDPFSTPFPNPPETPPSTPSSSSLAPEAPHLHLHSSKPMHPRARRRRVREPPTIQASLGRTGLVFPPSEEYNDALLPHLPSSLTLPTRVSSTGLAHSADVHIRGNTLLLLVDGVITGVMPLPLPTRVLSVDDGLIKIDTFARAPLYILPAEDAIGPLLRALRPGLPRVLTLSKRVSERIFLGWYARHRVGVRLFSISELPEYGIATRAVLQIARGEGIVPLLACVQGRGYCGLVMPVAPDLRMYTTRYGQLSGDMARGVVRQVMVGICRVYSVGGVVGSFESCDILMSSAHGAMIGRVSGIGSGGVRGWSVSMNCLGKVVRECCVLDDGAEKFVQGCERGWSAGEMLKHAWVREAPLPKVKRLAVGGEKIGDDLPRRIASGGVGTILGWEFVHR